MTDESSDGSGYKKFPNSRKSTGPHSERGNVDRDIREEILQRIAENPDIRLLDLVETISMSGHHKKSRVARNLMSLEDEGIISLSESQTCETILQFALSPDSTWFLTSVAAISVSLALVFAPIGLFSIYSEPVLYLKYLFGSVLVLFLPGYALMEALYPNRSPFDDLTRFTLSFVMSIAITVFVGLILGDSPLRLETESIALALALFVVTFLVIALKRKYDYYYITHRFNPKSA